MPDPVTARTNSASWARAVDRMRSEVRRDTADAFTGGALEAAVKRYVQVAPAPPRAHPVDRSGTLHDSIKIEGGRWVRPGVFQARGGPTAPYARVTELGHKGARLKRRRGGRGTRVERSGPGTNGGHPKPPYPFWGPGVAHARNEILRFWAEVWRAAVRRG